MRLGARPVSRRDRGDKPPHSKPAILVLSMSVAASKNVLPLSLPPRGLSRAEAAAYVGVGTSMFDRMVKDSRMPQPVRIDGRTVWDRVQLDRAFTALSDAQQDGDSPWDRVAV